LGEEVVPSIEAIGCVITKFALAFYAREEQCVSDSLRVGVRELGIGRVGEKDRSPLGGEASEVRGWVGERNLDGLSKQPRERRDGFGKSLRRARDDRLPAEKVTQKSF
jgi:hypothetical protein